MQLRTPPQEEDTASNTWADSAVEFDVREDPRQKYHEKEFADNSTIATSISVVDPDQERRLVRRIDLHILPLFCVFYFADFLDRSNIGNASLAGLQDDLKMTGPQLSTAISAFFITYILFQVPANILLKRFGAKKWLSFIMLAWGIITLCMAFVRDFGSLLVARLLLGASESGYIPGILFLLTRIYKPQELGFRVSILICTGALSGMASGPIAYAASMMPATTQRPWQYLFIMEGAPTVVLALISYWLLFDDLDEVRWLSDDLKAVQRARMAPFQSLNAHTSVKAGLRGALVDWKTWMFSLIHLLTSINITSLSVFAPFLIHGLGFPVLQAQLLTAPPCVVAAVSMLVCGILVDRLINKRALIVSIGSLLVAFGYCLLLAFPPALVWGMSYDRYGRSRISLRTMLILDMCI
ncbi:major facilitator superfamily domain-containing protein [Syncephalastrum racemosum]|uniref:Major facilitator superfamily domain-containing protein n=1 Tax=Syncephalastrum racemosum TaxID=13706 RepID=A0A1X2H4P9_SYNRA|nr:major facilitator superfamily domain-containing protein [Syncephalastrum racemosum]